MAQPSKVHWGQWVERRGKIVGFLMRKDFAAAVGSTPDQLLKWLRMPVPPKQMRKGFDEALALALKTTRQTLFVDYIKVAPEEATSTWVVPGENMPWHDPSWRSKPAEERFARLAFFMGDAQVEWILFMMEQIAQGKQVKQRQDFEAAAARLGETWAKNPDIPPLPPQLRPKPNDEPPSKPPRK